MISLLKYVLNFDFSKSLDIFIEVLGVFEDNTELEFLEKVEFAFLTSTLREVQAIETVNGVMLPLVSSPIIKKIKCEFDRISTSDQDP